MFKWLIPLIFLASPVFADCFCSQASGQVVYSNEGIASGTTNFMYSSSDQLLTLTGKDGTDSNDFAHDALLQYGFTEYRALSVQAGPAYGDTRTGLGLRYVPNEPFFGNYVFNTRTPSWMIESTYGGTILWGIGMAYNTDVLIGDPGSFLRGSYVPHTKLEVIGDISMPRQGNGLILKAIDGENCFRLRVLNNGNLNTSGIACPN